jgi:hypothetical protein
LQASAAYLHQCVEDPDPQKTQIRINMNDHTGFYMNSYKFLPKNQPAPKKNNLGSSVADPDPYVFGPSGPGPDRLVGGTEPAPDPNIKQK